MTPEPPASLQLPTFLHGTYASARQKAHTEGLRCARQYRQDATFSAPKQTRAVLPGEELLTSEVADFLHERPVWRLYMVSHVMSDLSEALDGQGTFLARDTYEEFFRETAWGALYFLLSPDAPRSATRTASRLQAVLRFWEPLRSTRYLFKTAGRLYTLEELVTASCGSWALEGWCPEGAGSVEERMRTAAERMARATRQDSLEVIFRQLPRVLSSARDLKHPEAVADSAFQRQRLARLDSPAFERISAACTSDLLEKLYEWDYELGLS